MRDGIPAAMTFSYPWDVPSSAGEAGRFSATCAAGALSFRYGDNFASATAGYHLVRVRAADGVVFEEDVAGAEPADTTSLSVPAGTVTIGLEEDLGVSNFGVEVTLADLSAPTCGEWTWTASTPDFTGTVGAVEGWSGMELYPMVYAVGTSWHADGPTAAVVGEAVDIALDAYDDGVADGVITYCLPKTDPEGDLFAAVQARYEAR